MPADSVSRVDASNASNNETHIPESILGTSPGASSLRSRTDSESSESLFVLPSMDGSPPKVMTFDEVTGVVKNLQNMELAHEIALNPEFRIQPYEPPENSFERRVRDMVHKAFWDLLRTQLEQTPPCYDHAIVLLNDIKVCFPQILPLTNNRALSHINEVLDPVLIRQQAEAHTLDFRSYANFIINVMAKSCAPIRDEQIKQLSELTDVVDVFRRILEIMSLMKLDMVNFLLDFSRNDILANSVEYEREKFKGYLDYFKKIGFPHTECWLMRNKVTPSNDASTSSTAAISLNEQSITNAYMELIDWNESVEFPEMLSMDKERILKYGMRAKRLCVGAALISICSAFPIILQRSEYRIELAKQISILLQDCNNDGDIASAMENIWEQIKAKINLYFAKENKPAMEENTERMLKAQIIQIGTKESPVRQLMSKRLKSYFRAVLIAKTGIPTPPPGFVDFKDELEAFAAALKRVIVYNHSVFGDFFNEILDGKHKTTTTESVKDLADMPTTSAAAKADALAKLEASDKEAKDKASQQ